MPVRLAAVVVLVGLAAWIFAVALWNPLAPLSEMTGIGIPKIFEWLLPFAVVGMIGAAGPATRSGRGPTHAVAAALRALWDSIIRRGPATAEPTTPATRAEPPDRSLPRSPPTLPPTPPAVGAALPEIAAFAPPEVRRNADFLVQVFFYAPALAATVARLARDSDPAASRRAVNKVDLDTGDSVLVCLVAPGTTIVDETFRFTWDGKWAVAPFLVHLPTGFEGETLSVRARILINGDPWGWVPFQLPVVARLSTPAPPPQQVGTGRHYMRVFCSHSSKDRKAVLARVQTLRANGTDAFVDHIDLQPGAEYEDVIAREIDTRDGFFLFWSANAAESPWVRHETARALARQQLDPDREPDIVPMVLEGPWADPPDNLRHVHFNDAIRVAILGEERAEQLRRKQRQKAKA